jgi:hypothetical protein
MGTHPWVRRVVPAYFVCFERLGAFSIVERPRLWLGLGHEHDHSALKCLCIFLTRLVDDDRLGNACWTSEMRELFEQKWFAVGERRSRERGSGVGKGGLRAREGNAWTRGRDGWNRLGKMGVSGLWFLFYFILVARFFTLFLRFFLVLIIIQTIARAYTDPNLHGSNLTFSLAPEWAFVDSEDWRRIRR